MSKPVVLDNKRRASFGPEFQPGDTFVRSVSGNRVTFEKSKSKCQWFVREEPKRDG